MSLLRPSAADSVDAPRWKWFWPIVVAGLGVRLLFAIGSDWALRADETIQYLEQAHRLVFGYGFVPWEFRFGVRTWLLPAIPAVPLFLTKILSIDSPDIYIPLVNSWNAILSMAIPIGMYCYMRRTVGELAARWALGFGCFWYEFLVFAPHAMAEAYSAALFMAALAVGYGAQTKGRLIIGGLLLGLAFATRVQYAPLIAIYGLIWLAILPRRLWALPLGGGVGGLLLWGGVDYLTWGSWWESFINYYEMFKNVLAPLVNDTLGTKPFYLNMFYILTTSAGLYAVIVVLSLASWRQHLPLIFMVVVVAAVHANPITQEYTNMFIIFPLLWMLAASAIAWKYQWQRTIKVAAAAAVVVSVFGLLNKLPFIDKRIYNTTESLMFYHAPGFQQTRQVGDVIGDELKTVPTPAILWTTVGSSILMGGYYHLHHRVPIYFLGDARHLKNFQESGLPQHQVFSHIVTQESRVPMHYEPVIGLPEFFIYRNNQPAQIVPLHNYTFDIFGGFFINLILGPAEDRGITLPDAPLTPFFKTQPEQ